MISDAHIHLADEAFAHSAECLIKELIEEGWSHFVINGTQPEDWDRVAELKEKFPANIIASYGYHPWFINRQSGSWQSDLETRLRADPGAAVGECGLDRWVKGYDLPLQREFLSFQTDLAARLNRPLTIHCLQAWGALLDFVKSNTLPARGFLVHAFSGSPEIGAELLKQGAYFSFSPYFLHDRKAPVRDYYKTLRSDRILIETDAPSMPPPGEKLSCPVNLRLCFQTLANLRPEPKDELEEQLEANFTKLFLSS